MELPFSTSVISAKALIGIKTRHLKLSYNSEQVSYLIEKAKRDAEKCIAESFSN
jgi:hypothetical protein